MGQGHIWVQVCPSVLSDRDMSRCDVDSHGQSCQRAPLPEGVRTQPRPGLVCSSSSLSFLEKVGQVWGGHSAASDKHRGLKSSIIAVT